MPTQRIPRKSIREFPILYGKRPFCVSSASDYNLHFLRSSLVDEDLALQLHLPIRNLQYQKFSFSEDKTFWSRLVGTVRISCQIIENGRAGKSFSLFAKVIRNLTEMTGAEAVCDELLEEKLSNLPVNLQLPEKKVKKWLKNNQDTCLYPATTATPRHSQCRCEWSAASTRGTVCCVHQGSCENCLKNLKDVSSEAEVDSLPDKQLDDKLVGNKNFFEDAPPDNSQAAMDMSLINLDDEDCDEEVVWYEVNQLVDGHIKVGTGIFEPHSGWTPLEPGDDLHVYRMTGDNLREFHRQNRTQFGAEEMTLRELDKHRRFYQMEFPGKPCVVSNYGDLDVYLKEEWKNLEAKKKKAMENSWRNLKENARRSLKEKAMTPISDQQPIGRPDFYPEVT